MRRSVTLGKAIGVAIPLVLIFCGGGCVSLDKPTVVAACAASNTCFDGEKKDAAAGKDAPIESDAAPASDGGTADAIEPADARPGADSLPAYDAGPADRADAGRAETNDALKDTAPDLGDVAQPDTRGEDDDDAADAADAPVKDAPGPDSADVAPVDTNTPPVDGGSTSVVTFQSGRGVGLMTGYGWVALGTGDTITSPTCGSGGAAITATAPCLSGTNWGTANPTALCVSGSIPSTAPPTTVTSGNWGIQVGVNAKDPNAGIGQAFKTIAVRASAVPTATEIRVELHRTADRAGETYCAKWTSSTTPIVLTTFNKACWDNSGAFLTAADVPTIDQVGLQVTSGTPPVTVSSMCLQSITFGN